MGNSAREFGELIPQEDFEETVCFQIEIPKTSEWEVAFRSLVLHFSQGRHWKRTETGKTIKETQEIGWQIYDSLSKCDPDEEPDDGLDQQIKIIVEKARKHMNCGCCPEEVTLQTTSQEEHIPNEIQDPPIQPDTVIPMDGDFEEWKCKSAKHIVNVALPTAVRGIADIVQIADAAYDEVSLLYKAAIGATVGGSQFVVLWVYIQALTFWMLQFLTTQLSDSLLNFLNQNSGLLVDAIFCSDDAQQAADDFTEVISSSSTLTLLQRHTLLLFVQGIPFEAHFQDAMSRMAAPAFDEIIANQVDDCTCLVTGGDLQLPAGYVEVPMFIDVVNSVNGGITTTDGNVWQFVGEANAGGDIIVFDPIFNLSTVPNANRRGFVFRNEFTDIQTGNGFGHNTATPANSMTNVTFGGAAGNFDADDIFAGVVASDATLQAWLLANVFKVEDPICTVDAGDKTCRWLLSQGGVNNPPDINTAIIRCTWIIETTGL